MSAKLVKMADHSVALSGILNVKTVTALHQQFLALSLPENGLEVDLQHVSYSDSAGVALLVEWLKIANKQRKKIVYTHIPQQMQQIVQVTGLYKIINRESR